MALPPKWFFYLMSGLYAIPSCCCLAAIFTEIMLPTFAPTVAILVERFDIEPFSDFQTNEQTLQGSFSSVSSLYYRRQILQENIRWKALDEIYKIYMLLHRSDRNISENFRQNVSHFMAKICKNSLFLNYFH